MAFLGKRSAAVAMLLVMGLVVVQARVLGLQGCKPVTSAYFLEEDWEIMTGALGSRKQTYCFKTQYTTHVCCEKEHKTRFEGCELADESRKVAACWGEKTVMACCTP